jgi:glucans biosynthesis protein C
MTSSTGIRVTSRPREQWADNLRVLVVAGVIVAHTAGGCLSEIGDWPYQELTPSALWGTVLIFPVMAGALFGLGPLFLLAGWFSVRSLQHRGPASSREADSCASACPWRHTCFWSTRSRTR